MPVLLLLKGLILMNKDKTNKRIRDLETVMSLSIVLMIPYFIFSKSVFIIVSLSLLVSGLLLKHITSVIVSWWLKVAETIAAFNTKVILSLVFYIVLTPIALLYRIFSKDPLCLQRKKSKTSYFYMRNHLCVKEDFEKMW
jgi:hypothetical protein